MDEGPLPPVALWVIACSVCVVFVGCGLWPYPVVRGIELEAVCCSSSSLSIVCDCWRCVSFSCGGPNPLTRGLTAPRSCVCEGWCGVAGQDEDRGGAFLACRLFLPCVMMPFAFFLSHPFLLRSCVEWPHAHGPCGL
ncbi:hypothetical protein TcCL_NonESM05231 [Trypanosoma cruzi]|nr:hypothetical protein TcCL_NonESM05231 [Trypanosoma cruzi]